MSELTQEQKGEGDLCGYPVLYKKAVDQEFTGKIEFGTFQDMFKMPENFTIIYPLTARQEKRKRRSERRNKKRAGGTRRAKRIKYAGVNQKHCFNGIIEQCSEDQFKVNIQGEVNE